MRRKRTFVLLVMSFAAMTAVFGAATGSAATTSKKFSVTPVLSKLPDGTIKVVLTLKYDGPGNSGRISVVYSSFATRPWHVQTVHPLMGSLKARGYQSRHNPSMPDYEVMVIGGINSGDTTSVSALYRLPFKGEFFLNFFSCPLKYYKSDPKTYCVTQLFHI
ncbi:MAG: hypothetical protein JWO96_102 [Candidatus Saccharibacteria bacterium]|nr:hypothetical protein [Candidatus Saccharibacteria bacterium]